MTKDKIYDIALGVAAVALVYAVVRSMKPKGASGPATGGSVFSTWNPFNPDTGESYDPANPGKYISLSDLVKGSINDYFTGGGQSYASVGDIRDTAIDDYYGNPSSGNSARDNGSVVFKPGTYW